MRRQDDDEALVGALLVADALHDLRLLAGGK